MEHTLRVLIALGLTLLLGSALGSAVFLDACGVA